MITVTILTKDSEKYIKSVLQPLQVFDEVLIFDTGSSDSTVDIATNFSNVTLHQGCLDGFGPTHNRASALANNDWILSLDSDEIMSADLVQEIQSLSLNEECIYSFWRKNMYKGKHIRGCGWYPDRVVRLYNRTKTSFCASLVHEAVQKKDLMHTPLSSFVTHHPYLNAHTFLQKMDSYTELFAQQHVGVKASFFTAVGHAIFAFCKSYILKKGFLLGSQGFEISWFTMNCAFYKYVKLVERNKE